MKKNIYIFFLLIPQLFFAQKHDNIWLFGYESYTNTPCFGGSTLEFNNLTPNINQEYRNMNFNITNASVCDSLGNLLFYTNGIYIANQTHEVMVNGDELSPGEFSNAWTNSGTPRTQGALIIPMPGNENLYYLFHQNIEYPVGDISIHASKLYYSLIDMDLNQGQGEVIEKNVVLIEDTLSTGDLTAVKHANGRDWWLLMPEYNSNKYYKLLLNPEGVHLEDNFSVGSTVPSGLSQTIFSPDGSKYIRINLIGGPSVFDVLDIYDFNRCSGLLSNHLQFEYADSASSGGVSVSPNSEFLYISHSNFIFQLSLNEIDIFASLDTVAIYDGFIAPEFPKSTRFFLCQLGPNGKIYINPPGGTKYLHLINHPNRPGDACEVLQHSIKLPTFNRSSLPNFPNYRLGPLDGSPCDTLGLNNHPLAGFTWEAEQLTGEFTDNSFYEPTDWLWHFGDNTTSTAVNPIHEYLAEGVYEVCLMVSNQYSSDTICQEVSVTLLTADFTYSAADLEVSFTDQSTFNPHEWLWEFGDDSTSTEPNPVHVFQDEGSYKVCLTVWNDLGMDKYCDSLDLMITGNIDIDFLEYFEVAPNPASDWLQLQWRFSSRAPAQWRLYDAFGQQVVAQTLLARQGLEVLYLEDLESGIYFWEVVQGGQKMESGKVVLVE